MTMLGPLGPRSGVEFITDQPPLRFGVAGLTDDVNAVFGVRVDYQPLPDWVAEPVEIARRLSAKRHDDLPEGTWQAVADLLAAARQLPSDERLDLRGWTMLSRVIQAARRLAYRLPAADPPVIGLPRQCGPHGNTANGPHRDVIDAVGLRLCDALADPDWIDPVVLAGTIADLIDALEDYRAVAMAWTGTGDRMAAECWFCSEEPEPAGRR